MRRLVLVLVLAGIALGSFFCREDHAVAGGMAVTGAGRVGPSPVSDRTIPSPSDFGFFADLEGGSFVCSMAGPATGGFAGTELMLVEGIVTPGTLVMEGDTARFRCFGSLIMVAGPDGKPFKFPPTSPPPAVIIPNAPFFVEVRQGGAGQGSLILETHLRDFLGGHTGGMLHFGEIRFVQ